jgi:hypothetical protein
MLVVKHTIATQQEGVLTVPWGLQFMVATRILGSQGLLARHGVGHSGRWNPLSC